jgi:hypothetical protein
MLSKTSSHRIRVRSNDEAQRMAPSKEEKKMSLKVVF